MEGEKDVETLRYFKVTATSNPMGAGKWRDSYTAALAGKNVIIIPDNDVAGYTHAKTVALSLLGKAASLKIVLFPEYFPLKGDVSDFITTHKDGHDAGFKALTELINQAPALITPADVEKVITWALGGVQQLEEKQDQAKSQAKEKAEREAPAKAWEKARELFPVAPFPWRVLPPALAESLQILARSCSSSPTALPGAAVAIFASAFGRTIQIRVTSSHTQPLIFWFGDIRESGEGKTPPHAGTTSPSERCAR